MDISIEGNTNPQFKRRTSLSKNLLFTNQIVLFRQPNSSRLYLLYPEEGAPSPAVDQTIYINKGPSEEFSGSQVPSPGLGMELEKSLKLVETLSGLLKNYSQVIDSLIFHQNLDARTLKENIYTIPDLGKYFDSFKKSIATMSGGSGSDSAMISSLSRCHNIERSIKTVSEFTLKLNDNATQENIFILNHKLQNQVQRLCPQCRDQETSAYLIVDLNCGHYFCWNCMNQSVRNAKGYISCSPKVKCIDRSCSHLLNMNELFKALGSSEQEYNNFMLPVIIYIYIYIAKKLTKPVPNLW